MNYAVQVILVSLLLTFANVVLSTPGIFHAQLQCATPSLDGEYMNGPNLKGELLQLFISKKSDISDPNDKDNLSLGKLSDFVGYSYDTEYMIKISTKDESWMQFVIDTSNGEIVNPDFGDVECKGKQLHVPYDFNEALFEWKSPKSPKDGNTNIEITVAYAPYFTQTFIQTFEISLQNARDSREL